MANEVDRLLGAALQALQADDAMRVEAETTKALEHLNTGDPRRARAMSIRGAGRMLSDPRRGLADMFEAAELAPDDAQVLHAYGDALLSISMSAEAEAPLGRAVQVGQGHPDIVASYCRALLELKKTALAKSILQRVVNSGRVTPNLLRAWSKTLFEQGDIYSARDVLLNLYGEAGPRSEADRLELARIEMKLREFEPAKRLIDGAVSANPGSVFARKLAVQLADWMDDAAARTEHANALMSLAPEDPDALALMVEHASDATPEDYARAEAMFLDEARLPSDGLIRLGYALGLHFDRGKDYEHAWRLACRANAMFGSYFRFEQTEERRAEQDRVMRRRLRYALHLYEETRVNAGAPGAFQYIYLIGSPRSGSTLLQSILSAPEGISSIGERTSLYPYLSMATEREAPMEEFSALTQQLHSAETAGLKRMGFEGPVLVEKTPHHMYVAGLLERVNPGSRFVNVLRDAGDVALSMFLRPFSAHFPESSNLDALADTISLRMEIADAWRNAGLNVQAFSFDEFRASPDPQGEMLFDRLGLSWSPEYLDPKHRSDAITTFSAQQIRSKVYAPSKPHWTNYEAFAPEAFSRLAEVTQAQNALLSRWEDGANG